MPSTASTRRVGRLVLGILLRRIPMPSLPRVRGEATRSRQSRRMSPRGSRKSKKAQQPQPPRMVLPTHHP
jgi:hypothetical protein